MQGDSEKHIINMHSFHNLWYIYEVLPKQLTQVKLDHEDQKQHHLQVARKMRYQVAQAKWKRKRNATEVAKELDTESQ